MNYRYNFAPAQRAAFTFRLCRLIFPGVALILALAVPFNFYGAETKPNLGRVTEPIVLLKIADLHVTGSESMQEFKQVIEFANQVIHPTLTLIAGDTPDGGTLEQYQAYKAVMDTLSGPVFNLLGDHEAKGGGSEHYRKVLGEPTYSFALGMRYQVVGLNSMALDEAQLTWARKELAAAQKEKRIGIMFIHHNFAGIKDKTVQEKLQALVKDTGVKMVLAGHTHNNTIINDGAGLQITTTSIKEPRGSDPKGYAIVLLDEGRISWHFVPLGQSPVVAICNPLSKLMATGPEGVVRGKTALRVKAFGPKAVQKVSATVNGGAAIGLSEDKDGLWTGQWDASSAPDGEHKLKVEATCADGKTGVEEITIVVNQGGQYAAAPMTVSDGKGGGGKGPKDGKGAKDGKEPKAKGKKQPVALGELPPAVRAALEKEAGKAEFDKLEKEAKEGLEVFTAKWGPKETEREIKLTTEGAPVEAKEAVKFEMLPEAARTAASKAQPNAKTFECKKITTYNQGSKTILYEVRAVRDGEKSPPLRVTPEGHASEGKGGKPKK